MLRSSKYIKLIYVFGSAHVKIGVWIKACPQPLFPAEPGVKNGAAEPSRIISAVSNWFRRRTSHELNSLNSIRLMWSTASEPGLRSRNGLIRKLEPFITHSITTIINNIILYITLHIAPYQQFWASKAAAVNVFRNLQNILTTKLTLVR